MNNFNTRKAARIAAGNINKAYKFVVTCDSLSIPVGVERSVGTFASRKAAEHFAYAQIGPVAGNSAAMQEAGRIFGMRYRLGGTTFTVSRTEV